ncbi:MAG: DUF2628 domain-containing protein [Dongiaceae bacterium]
MTDIVEGSETESFRTMRDDLCDFIGPNAEKYLRAYNSKGWAGYSFAAALIPIPWLMYRKMYVATAGFLFVAVIIGVLLPHGGFSLAGAFGAMGKTLYLTQAERKIRKIDARDLPVAERMSLIRRAGGISWLGAAIGTIITIGLTVAVIAADYLPA